MLAALTARSAQRDRGDYQVSEVLTARLPVDDSIRIEQGHYRIGQRDGWGQAHEGPAQLVELHAFRIGRRPVNNAEMLAFIEDGGYRDPAWWDEAGRGWRDVNRVSAPWNWRRDARGHWYGIGTNGPLDLHPDEVVAGLSAHEARAYAAWAAARGNGLAGAVPQHEYQWEVAARLGEITLFGRSWEWCANAYHPYPGYQAPADPLLDPCAEDRDLIVLRGGCLHTQPALRRSTFRRCAPPDRRELFAGTRLVLPPGKAAWE
jgi:iron(II)-dependent oxidoreductase